MGGPISSDAYEQPSSVSLKGLLPVVVVPATEAAPRRVWVARYEGGAEFTIDFRDEEPSFVSVFFSKEIDPYSRSSPTASTRRSAARSAAASVRRTSRPFSFSGTPAKSTSPVARAPRAPRRCPWRTSRRKTAAS